jgi:hypothetical protein
MVPAPTDRDGVRNEGDHFQRAAAFARWQIRLIAGQTRTEEDRRAKVFFPFSGVSADV